MANRVIAKRNVVAVGNHGLIALGDGERNKVVSLAAERGRHRHRHHGNHAVKIVVGYRDLARTRIADAIRRL